MAKQHYCFLERFNNYFNRKIIRHETLEDYQSASNNSYIPEDAEGNMLPFDFNPNDNITTEIIANSVPFVPDYFLLLDDEQNIVSRWFVLEQKRNRQGQWLYELRRDVIADYKNELANSPAFIEKGMLNENDPFIFNPEGMSFNQIKKSEFLLKDLSGCAWIVGYIAKNAAASDVSITVPTNAEGYINLSVIAADLGISEADLGALLNFDGQNTNVTKFTSKVEFRYGSRMTEFPTGLFRERCYMDGDLNYLSEQTNDVFSWSHVLVEGPSSALDIFDGDIGPAIEAEKANILPNMSAITGRTYLSTSQLTKLRNYINKIIYYNGNYYRLTLNITGEGADAVIGPSAYTTWPSIATAVVNAASLIVGLTLKSGGEISIRTTSQNVYIQMAKVSISSYTTKVSSSRRTVLNENFDMFVIPFGPLGINGVGGLAFDNDQNAALAVASQISVTLDAQLYDLQLLPYYPDDVPIVAEGTMDLDSKTVDVDYNAIYDSNSNPVSVIIWCKKNSFSRNLDYWMRSEMRYSYNSAYAKKLCSECEKFRLVSPNYQGSFDFNLAKNEMEVNYLIAECTYKPFTPYIKVAPEFRGLYGVNYNDCRGLICGGDFSLPRFTSAWQNYQLNNKNYQNIFNREIQNLDFEQAQEWRYKQITGVAGIVGAGGSGAAVGAKLGGVWGAVAGAVAGTGVSAAGYGLDLDMMGKRHKEARDFAIDKYNYNLGNIKALPYTLTKVSAFDINSKIWPFMEYYCCTEEEISALVDKITFESMTVMRIETIGNYFKDNLTYLKCQLIRNSEIKENNRVLETIYTELEKGVYI